MRAGLTRMTIDHIAEDELRAQTRDLYIPAGDIGLWQGALRDREDPRHREVADAIARREPITVELLYSDQVGAQRTITRFTLAPLGQDGADNGVRCDQRRPALVPRSGRAALTRSSTAPASAAISRTISPAGRASTSSWA